MINPTLSEWLNLIFRWIHVFAAIMWVGTTYYFTWLDARLTEEEKAVANTGTAAQIWMVHSGGFYVVGKRKTPSRLSSPLEMLMSVVTGMTLRLGVGIDAPVPEAPERVVRLPDGRAGAYRVLLRVGATLRHPLA